MPYLKYRNTGRGVPLRMRRKRRRMVRRRKPMTSGRVKRIIDAELKVHDNFILEFNLPSITGATFHLSNIGVGDSNTTRTGNWIKPTALKLFFIA